ncbi:MAG: UrcA family protein [Pseudomonadota bacterium]|nr:UrcA family protein [Pseudomonadota bacterium]
MTKFVTIASTLRLSAIVSALAFAAPAQAQGIEVTAKPVPTAAVSFADLDLGSPAGVARLKNRIETAASGLCRTNAVEPVDMKVARRSCYRHALGSGFRQMDQILASRSDGPASTAAAASLTISVP